VEVGDGGIFSVTGEFLDRNRSDRSEPRGNPRTIGDSAVEQGTLNINSEIPLTDSADLYFTAGIQNRRASSGAFARDGVDDVPSRNSLAMYPDGFVPFINGDLEDRFATLGARGLVGEWNADLSATYGYNELFYDISNTLNASIANFELLNQRPAVSNTAFDAGGFSFRQFTTNLDFTRYFDDLWGGTNIAFGGEYRDENYQIFAGEPGSYIDADGPGGGNAGSQGFPGFQPGDETDANRDNYAAYVDVEDHPDRAAHCRLRAALRGLQRFRLDRRRQDRAGVQGDRRLHRARLGVLRLPRALAAAALLLVHLHRLHQRRTGGCAAGAQRRRDCTRRRHPDLTEETSMSGTHRVSPGAPPIRCRSRSMPTRSTSTTASCCPAASTPMIRTSATSWRTSASARRSSSSIRSTPETRGIDLTASWDTTLWHGELTTFLGFNYGETDVTSIHAPPALVGREDVLLSERERLFIENGAPESKGVLGFDWTREKWNANVKLIWFGEQTLGTFSGPPVPNQHYNAKASADEPDLQLTRSDQADPGAANIFDTKPTRQNADETDNGHVYESVQFGLNGASWFLRMHSRFF
jgi:iron complex outermembrane receptor protein